MTASEDRKEEDIRKFTGVCKNILRGNITEKSLKKIIKLGMTTINNSQRRNQKEGNIPES